MCTTHSAPNVVTMWTAQARVVVCRKSTGRHPCHTVLKHIIKRALAAADIPSLLEPTALCHSNGKRANGVAVIPWKRDWTLAWDVTCWDTLTPSYIPYAATGAAPITNLDVIIIFLIINYHSSI